MPISCAWVGVVAVALSGQDGRIFLQQRPARKHHGGLWEFPGGKIEAGETPRQALIREIEEELALTLKEESLVAGPFAEEVSDIGAFADGAGKRRITLLLYRCNKWAAAPVPQEGQEAGWFTREQALALPLAPMDRDLLERLGP